MLNDKRTIFRQKQILVEKNVFPENLNWPREMKIANKLWNQYPDLHFWNSFVLPFKLDSLAWLLKDGQPELNRQWNYFKLDKNRKEAKIELLEKPIEEPKIEAKPKTIKDWLRK